jgi:uncharacterized protein (TIGR00304 family)
MDLVGLGLLVIFVGFILVFVGAIYEALKSSKGEQRPEGRSEYGGVIFIGPVPIIFGTKKVAKWMIVVAAVITAILVSLFIIQFI